MDESLVGATSARRKRWRVPAAAGAGLLILGVGLAVGHRAGADPQPAAAPLAVSAWTVPADATGGSDGASYAATIHRDREVQLSFRVPGRIAALPVHAGDHLTAGAEIARLENVPYAAGVARSSADATRTARTASRLGGLVVSGAVAPADAADAVDAAHAAAAGADAARYDLASTHLAMPFSGTVMTRPAEAGETLAAGQPVVTVADDTSVLLARVDVPLARAAALHGGDQASVIIDGAVAPVIGVVWRKAGAADPRTGTIAVDLRLPAGTVLAVGTPAAVRFGAVTPQHALRLPAEALLDAHGNEAAVLVIDARGIARRQSVQFLGFDDRFALVSGLAVGTRVITAGAGFVSAGAAVQVVGS